MLSSLHTSTRRARPRPRLPSAQADLTLLAVGGALVMAPVIFGKDWFGIVLFLLGTLGGAVGVNAVLQTEGAFLWGLLSPYAVLGGEEMCLASLVLVLALALAIGALVHCMRPLALFAVGFFGAGFGAWAVSGLAVPLLQEFLTPQFGITVTSEAVDIACAAAALIGGLLLCRCGLALVDAVLGLVGSFLVGLAVVNVASLDLINAELATTLRLQEFYMYYVLGVAALVEILRCTLVCCREARTAAAPPSASPGSSLAAKAARVAPAGKAKPGGKSPPRGKGRAMM